MAGTPSNQRGLQLALFTMLASFHAAGQDHHEAHEAEQGTSRAAHTHGTAELLIVLEGQQLDIELHSPAVNLLGFEHRVETPDQRARVESARSRLAQGDSLFHFDGGQCQMAAHSVDFAELEGALPGGQGDDEATSQGRGQHNDIRARYRYQCAEPDGLRALLTDTHIAFPGIRDLEVQWIIEGRQGAITLDNEHRHVIFR